MFIERELKKELIQIKNFLLSLVAVLPAGFIAIDRNGIIIVANQKALDLLDKQEKIERIIDKDIFSVIAGLHDLEAKLQECIRYRRFNIFIPELRIAKRNNDVFISVTGKPITHGMLLLLEDITRIKTIERMEAEFVSIASHQLRTPLTAIEWTAELFSRKETLTNKGKEYLNDIRFSAKRLNTLIKLLLDVSRIESGHVGVSPEPLELVEFINEHISEFQILCKKKKISLAFIKHPKKLVVTTDRNMLGYIVQNLVSNAINYTLPEERIEMVLKSNKDNVFFTVRDTGIGIPEKEQARIFKKFVRASNAISMKPDGTGLGLFIVAEAVKLLGGRIWFDSVEGKGSSFFVKFPLVSQPRAGEKGLILQGDFIKKDKIKYNI